MPYVFTLKIEACRGLRRNSALGISVENVDLPACLTISSDHSDFIHKFKNVFSV